MRFLFQQVLHIYIYILHLVPEAVGGFNEREGLINEMHLQYLELWQEFLCWIPPSRAAESPSQLEQMQLCRIEKNDPDSVQKAGPNDSATWKNICI